MILAWLLLLTGLTISAVAIYYSVVGLTAIFSAAVIPIIIMGSALEVGKLVCASWLKANWEKAPRFIKYYMIIAVVVLMLITSMGIFGFLSKAHNDQNLVSGDVTSKIAIYDEKIKTERENIDANRKVLKQLDESVDQVMGRSSDEKGAEKAVAIRRAQQKERSRLAQDISEAQKRITALNEERAPIAAEVRKVEAEVGPIKYIAAFVYGETSEGILERAVTWVIITLIVVFDPMAVILLLASQISFQRFREQEEEQAVENWFDQGRERARQLDEEEDILSSKEFFPHEEAPVPKLSDPELDPCYKCGTPLVVAPGIGPFCPNKECDVFDGPFVEEPVEVAPEPVVEETSLFVQNEEQKLSNLWSTTVKDVEIESVSREEYLEYSSKIQSDVSQRELTKIVTQYIEQLRNGSNTIDDIPPDLVEIVKHRT